MRNRAVIYARLSREDENKIDGNKESRSIENQIEGLTTYAKEHDLDIVKIYYDDGYSGGTLERPALQNMLKDMRLKQFDIVLIKDISRLGRSLHRVGELIEKIFPENNIRVISINDKYDSSTYNQTESIVLKNFLNDYYLKEFRRKCKQAREHYAHTKHLNYYPKYGYNFDSERNEIVDDYSAGIVRKIFDLVANQNYNLYQVARYLNSEGIFTRSRYATEILGLKGLHKRPAKEWNANKVFEIVDDFEYCGHSINWSSHKKEDWILIKNTHNAIIDEKLYYKAQEAMKKRSYLAKHNYIRPNHLGRILIDVNIPERHYFFSNNYKYPNQSYYFSRYSKNKIYAKVIENVVYDDVIDVINKCLNNSDRLYNEYKQRLFKGKEYKKEPIEEKLKKLNEAYSSLIENYYNQSITEYEFKKKSSTLIDNIKELEEELKSCQKNQSVISLFEIKFKKFLEDIKHMPENKIDVIKMAVDKIIINKIYDNKNIDITIKYKFEM